MQAQTQCSCSPSMFGLDLPPLECICGSAYLRVYEFNFLFPHSICVPADNSDPQPDIVGLHSNQTFGFTELNVKYGRSNGVSHTYNRPIHASEHHTTPQTHHALGKQSTRLSKHKRWTRSEDAALLAARTSRERRQVSLATGRSADASRNRLNRLLVPKAFISMYNHDAPPQRLLLSLGEGPSLRRVRVVQEPVMMALKGIDDAT